MAQTRGSKSSIKKTDDKNGEFKLPNDVNPKGKEVLKIMSKTN
jgi:hypothetical protein